MRKQVSWIARAVQGQAPDADAWVTGSVQTDSRLCAPGSLYVARVGETSDGHDFVAAAARAGAGAAIVERKVEADLPQIVVEDATLALGLLAKEHLADLRKTQELLVVGITGSAGKTTTKDLAAQLLSEVAPTVAPELSFNNEVGCPLTILEADEDTRYLVLEMGASGPGHVRYLTQIAPLDVAVELIVGAAHLGGFGSLEVLAESKQELVEGLLPTGAALLNYDDEAVRQMAAAAPGPVTFFSAAQAEGVLAEGMLVWAEEVQLDGSGRPGFWLCTQAARQWTQLTLVGEHQVTNALAAAGIAVLAGVPLEQIAASLASAERLAPHRMDVRHLARWEDADNVVLIDDSYNANPDSMAAGLRTARRIAGKGRLVAVLGEMLELGEDSDRLHKQVGEAAAAEGVDVLITVGAGATPLVSGAGVATRSHQCVDHGEALRLLPAIIESADTLFLKGSLGAGVWKIADALVETAATKTATKTD